MGQRLSFASLILILAAAVSLSACGRENTVYSDGDGIAGFDDFDVTLPADFYDQSVNGGLVDIKKTATGKVLRLNLFPTTPLAGAFNDPTATGNRAIVAVTKYDQTPLADLDVSFSATSSTGAKARVSVLVDLLCDGTQPVRTLITDELDSHAGVNDAVWSVSGTAITDASSTVLVPSSSGSARSSLQDLLAEYPTACLRNAVSDALESPVGVSMGSLQLSIGGLTTNTRQEIRFSTLEINGDVYDSWDVP